MIMNCMDNIVNIDYIMEEKIWIGEKSEKNVQTITITEESINFDAINLEQIKLTKTAINFAKEKTKLEQNGEVISEQEGEALLEKCKNEINLDHFQNASCDYEYEYSQDEQCIYITTNTQKENELYLSYDLKRETLTLCEMDFQKVE